MKQTHPTVVTRPSTGIVPYLTSGTAQSYNRREKCNRSTHNSTDRAALHRYRLRRRLRIGQLIRSQPSPHRVNILAAQKGWTSMPKLGKAGRWGYRCLLAIELTVVVLLVLGGCY